MKVLHVLPSFVPAYRYGGPVKGLFELCRSLVKHGVDITVFTTNIDGPGQLDVPVGDEVVLDGVKTHYFQIQNPRSYSYSEELSGALKNRVKDFDLVHIHSIFNWPSTSAMAFCRKFGVPYILRPAGMLEDFSIKQRYMGFCKSLV
ncbi:MAG: glycosyltransferase, partial [Planctomycetes bacterium]|nr:glycosyltransferase [Planctomycetota bacterium]